MRKHGMTDKVSEMADLYSPPIGLLCKLGSIVVHVDEATGDRPHEFDWTAIRALLADRDVQAWIEGMTKAGFMPVKRS